MVVNKKENLPVTIVQFKSSDLNFLLTREFLEHITKPGLNNGCKRDGYYIINVDGILRIPQPQPVGDYRHFMKLLEVAQTKGYNLLMILI